MVLARSQRLLFAFTMLALSLSISPPTSAIEKTSTGNSKPDPHSPANTPTKKGIQSGDKTEKTVSSTDAPVPRLKAWAPKDKHLKDIYDRMVAFRCDQAISRLSSLNLSLGKKSLSNKDVRLARARNLILIGEAYRLDENLSGARIAFSQAYQLAPDDTETLCNLAKLERAFQNFDREDELLEKLRKSGSTSPTAMIFESAYARRRVDLEQAEYYLKQAIKYAGGTTASTEILLGRLALVHGLGETAAQHFRNAAEMTENPYTRELLMGNAAFLENDQLEYEKRLRKAGTIYPYDPIWHTQLAQHLLHNKQDSEGWKHFELAMQCKRFYRPLYYPLIQHYHCKKRYDLAFETLAELEKLDKEGIDGLVTVKADLYKKSGDKKKALSYYREAIKRNPYLVDCYQQIANLLLADKKDDEAVEVMRRCCEKVNSFQARLALGSMLAKTGHWDEAAAKCQEGLSMMPKDEANLNIGAKIQAAQANAVIGTKHYKAGDLKNAMLCAKSFNRLNFVPDLPQLLKLIHIRPGHLVFTNELGLKDPMARAALADMLFERKLYDLSVNEYRQALEIMPDNTELHSFLMHVYSTKGDWLNAGKENFELSGRLVKGIPGQLGLWKKKNPEPKPGDKESAAKASEPAEAVENRQP